MDIVMDKARIFATFFEFLPILLACWVVYAAYKTRKHRGTTSSLLVGFSALTLIALQLSWFKTFVVDGNVIATVLISNGWTIHNALVMLGFLYVLKDCKNKCDKW